MSQPPVTNPQSDEPKSAAEVLTGISELLRNTPGLDEGLYTILCTRILSVSPEPSAVSDALSDIEKLAGARADGENLESANTD